MDMIKQEGDASRVGNCKGVCEYVNMAVKGTGMFYRPKST
jgi:hypothetical protein